MTKTYYVYMLTNLSRTTLYIGVTNDLPRRLYEHKNEIVKGFTSKYKLKSLIYYEAFTNIQDAITREKQLKNWHRDWKVNLVKSVNPGLIDLDVEIEDPEFSSGPS